MSKTYLPKVEEIKRQWYEVDAEHFTLGRLASRVATILRGKHKATFTPHLDLGDFVVVRNARRVKVSGRKLLQKTYFRVSGYPGGLKKEILRDVLQRKPEKVIYEAVRRMLAPNRLRKNIMKRLKIVPEGEHNYKIDKKLDAQTIY